MLVGRETIEALSWVQVDGVVGRLAPVNSYDRVMGPGSILKIEVANFDPVTSERRQFWCVSIAAKRYALFIMDASGNPCILPDGHKRHGLGCLIDPRDPSDDDDDAPGGNTGKWEAALWEGIVRERLGLPHHPAGWEDRPAVARRPVSSPWHLAAFAKWNRGKPYAEQIKPFNFMLTTKLAHQGRPRGVEPGGNFSLVAPFETDAKKWGWLRWTDLYSGRAYTVTTVFPGGGEGTAGVLSMGSVARAYPYHPESKRVGSDGRPCHKMTEGLLIQRPVRAGGAVCIGKEAHRLEERDLVTDLDDLVSVYADPRREPWTMEVLPKLRALAADLGAIAMMAERSGLKPRALRDVIAGRSRPRVRARELLTKLVATRHPHDGRRCTGCGGPIGAADSRRRYCSRRCRDRARSRRLKSEGTEKKGRIVR